MSVVEEESGEEEEKDEKDEVEAEKKDDVEEEVSCFPGLSAHADL